MLLDKINLQPHKITFLSLFSSAAGFRCGWRLLRKARGNLYGRTAKVHWYNFDDSIIEGWYGYFRMLPRGQDVSELRSKAGQRR
jgi:hypothetical protein